MLLLANFSSLMHVISSQSTTFSISWVCGDQTIIYKKRLLFELIEKPYECYDVTSLPINIPFILGGISWFLRCVGINELFPSASQRHLHGSLLTTVIGLPTPCKLPSIGGYNCIYKRICKKTLYGRVECLVSMIIERYTFVSVRTNERIHYACLLAQLPNWFTVYVCQPLTSTVKWSPSAGEDGLLGVWAAILRHFC